MNDDEAIGRLLVGAMQTGQIEALEWVTDRLMKLEQAEAELLELRVRRDNELLELERVRGDNERLRAALAAAREEAQKWEFAARHKWVCPLGEMNPGEPGSYLRERSVGDALLARYQPADEGAEA